MKSASVGDFVQVGYNGKIYHGFVDTIKTVQGRMLMTISFGEVEHDEYGSGVVTRYRSFYLDKASVTITCPEAVA